MPKPMLQSWTEDPRLCQICCKQFTADNPCVLPLCGEQHAHPFCKKCVVKHSAQHPALCLNLQCRKRTYNNRHNIQTNQHCMDFMKLCREVPIDLQKKTRGSKRKTLEKCDSDESLAPKVSKTTPSLDELDEFFSTDEEGGEDVDRNVNMKVEQQSPSPKQIAVSSSESCSTADSNAIKIYFPKQVPSDVPMPVSREFVVEIEDFQNLIPNPAKKEEYSVYCTICGFPHVHNLAGFVFDLQLVCCLHVKEKSASGFDEVKSFGLDIRPLIRGPLFASRAIKLQVSCSYKFNSSTSYKGARDVYIWNESDDAELFDFESTAERLNRFRKIHVDSETSKCRIVCKINLESLSGKFAEELENRPKPSFDITDTTTTGTSTHTSDADEEPTDSEMQVGMQEDIAPLSPLLQDDLDTPTRLELQQEERERKRLEEEEEERLLEIEFRKELEKVWVETQEKEKYEKQFLEEFLDRAQEVVEQNADETEAHIKEEIISLESDEETPDKPPEPQKKVEKEVEKKRRGRKKQDPKKVVEPEVEKNKNWIPKEVYEDRSRCSKCKRWGHVTEDCDDYYEKQKKKLDEELERDAEIEFARLKEEEEMLMAQFEKDKEKNKGKPPVYVNKAGAKSIVPKIPKDGNKPKHFPKTTLSKTPTDASNASLPKEKTPKIPKDTSNVSSISNSSSGSNAPVQSVEQPSASVDSNDCAEMNNLHGLLASEENFDMLDDVPQQEPLEHENEQEGEDTDAPRTKEQEEARWPDEGEDDDAIVAMFLARCMGNTPKKVDSVENGQDKTQAKGATGDAEEDGDCRIM